MFGKNSKAKMIDEETGRELTRKEIKRKIKQEKATQVNAIEQAIKERKEARNNERNKLREELANKEIPNDKFGPILQYIEDPNVTDINWNGSELWIDDLEKGRYMSDIVLDKSFIAKFSSHISNIVSEQFNKYRPLLEAETSNLRVSILHEDVLATGRSISIRKTPAIKRIDFMKSIRDGEYTTVEIANLLSNAVKARFNIVVCGLPGVGKTELIKYLTSYIPAKDRVITIEDNLEIHYREINPGKDCVEVKVDNDFDYTHAIKASLRQFPTWVMMAEARSVEVKYLIEAMSTGTHCLTTLHTDDVRRVPDRIKNMIGDALLATQIQNDVYSSINMAILVDKKYEYNEETNTYKINRYISQVATFDRDEDGVNTVRLLVNKGERTDEKIQENLVLKMRLAGISEPYEYTFIKY